MKSYATKRFLYLNRTCDFGCSLDNDFYKYSLPIKMPGGVILLFWVLLWKIYIYIIENIFTRDNFSQQKFLDRIILCPLIIDLFKTMLIYSITDKFWMTIWIDFDCI